MYVSYLLYVVFNESPDLRTIPGSIVFYPADAVAAERATELAANTRGIAFIRTGRPALPVIYNNDEIFEVGKGKVGVSLLYIVCICSILFSIQ